MPQLTQGQGSTPYEGANIFGAGVAGYETPVGTNLSPEAEHMLRAALMKQLTGIAKLKMEMAIQSTTSYANIAVSVQRATTDALSAAIEFAKLEHLDNVRINEMILAIEEASGSMAMSAGHSYEPKTQKRITDAGKALNDSQLSGGLTDPPTAIAGFISTAIEQNYTGKQIADGLGGLVGRKNTNFGLVVSSSIDALTKSGAPITTIVDTKDLARQQIATSSDTAFDKAMSELRSQGGSQESISYFMDNHVLIKGQFFNLGIRPEDKKNIEIPGIDRQKADKIRMQGSVKLEALRRITLGMGVGVPASISDPFNKLVDMSTSIVEDGPESFAKSLQSMPTPLSVQLTEQKAQYQMDQLDNPTDPLSEAVARYASVIPYFSNYMAAMGMDDPLTAVEYLMEHPVDRQEYFNIIKVLTDTGKIDQINNPEALQERLRVAGSSDQDSIFRTSFLTKPLERLFGIGLNRPEAWRYFDGRNSKEQLQNAITALTAVGDDRLRADIEATAKKNLADGVVIDAADESVEDGSGLESWVVEEDTKGQPTKVAIELEGGLVGVYSTSDYASPDEAMAAANDGSGGVVVSYSTKAEEQRALKDSYQSQVPGYVRALSDDSADPTIEIERPNNAEPKSKYREFAENLPEGKREKALTAAEKYLKRLDPTYVRPGDTSKEGRYMLSGIEPEPIPVVREEPAPDPVAPVAKTKTLGGLGTNRDPNAYNKAIKDVEQDLAEDAAEIDAAKVEKINAERAASKKRREDNKAKFAKRDAADTVVKDAEAKKRAADLKARQEQLVLDQEAADKKAAESKAAFEALGSK
tara:strand:+ start:14753 stop:17185 length:2433 start_codon:yes stop_codon:yes gene_type:complete